MKSSSKILSVFLALLAIGMVISAASAVDLSDEFKNDDFGMNVVSGSNFTESVNVATGGIELAIFENSGNDASDVNSIIYFKDSTSNKNEINGFIDDLENNGDKVEQTDKYVVLKNTQKSNNFDIENDLDGIFSFAESIFSDGLNVSADGNAISFSDNGLEVSSADGENVSITTAGISVSGASDNETVDVSSDVDSDIANSDYSVYLKNQDNDKVIVISGNNLELLKAMAETATFNEN